MSNDPIIPFGKYKGEYASDVPVEYLDWLLGQEWFVEKFEFICNDIERHLKESRPEWKNL